MNAFVYLCLLTEQMKMHCKINMLENKVNAMEDHDCFAAGIIERMIYRGHSPAFGHRLIQSSQNKISVIVKNILSTIMMVVWEIASWHVKKISSDSLFSL